MATRPGSSATTWLRRVLLGDAPSLVETLDDAVVLHVPGSTGLSGEFQGAEAVLGLCAHMNQLTAGTIRFSPFRMLGETHGIVIIEGTVSGARGRSQLESRAVHVFLYRSDRIREIWLFYEDQSRVDEFWWRLNPSSGSSGASPR